MNTHSFSRTVALLCLLSCALTAAAQKKMSFTGIMTYQPEKKYVSSMKTNSQVEINFDADEAFLEQIQASGMSLPMAVEAIQQITTSVTTGKRASNGDIPFTLTYDEFKNIQKMNGQEMSQPNPFEDTRIEGRTNAAGKFEIDSIYGNLQPAIKEGIESMMKSIQQEITFPEKPLKIGESFMQEVPLEVPTAGAGPIKVLIKTNYTLKEIKNGSAFFDLAQDVTLDMSIEQNNATANGTGVGKMVFDMKEAYATSFNSNLTIQMEVALSQADAKMIMESKVNVTQTTAIE